MATSMRTNLDAGGVQKVVNLAPPTAAGDAATKGYVDSAVNGLEWKAPAVVAATGNLAALSGLLTVDGVTVSDGQRVLAPAQTTGSQNGLWVAHSGAWTRPTDYASGSTQQNAAVFVEAGTANASKSYVISGTGAITVDTTASTWVQFAQITPITGGTGITVTAGVVALATLKGKAAATITGDGATTAFSITHTLNDTDVVVQVKDSSGNWVVVDTQATDATHVTVTFGTAPVNASTWRVVIVG